MKCVKSIFDKFEHIGIYVVDRRSLNVYYENPIAQKYTGKNRIGEPCYLVHGNDEMCSSCPIRRKEHISNINRSDYDMVFVVRSEETIWDGHEAYMISVVKRPNLQIISENEKSLSRMSRALQNSVSVYTEINMDTMEYKQINLNDYEGFSIESEGDYDNAFEYLCTEEIHPDDVTEIRRLMAPEVLKKISHESEGVKEVKVTYRMKKSCPERIMESKAFFMRDEVPHYVVNITKDVTKEVQLRKQADELENILSHVSCGVAIYSITEDGNVSVEYANEGLARLAECSRNVLMQEFSKDAMYGIDENYRPVFTNTMKKIIAGEKKSDGVVYATTYKGNRIWLHADFTSSKKEDGFYQVYCTYFDVTSDMKIQREFLEKYEIERRRSQDDATVLAYAVFDLQNNRTIEMERRFPFNKIENQFSLDEFCTDISYTIVSKEKKALFIEMFNTQNLLENHEKGIDEQNLEYQRKLPSGKIIWVKSSFRVISDPSKNTVMLFYYCNDINVSKSLELMTAYMVDEDYDMIGCINLEDDNAIMLYGKNSSMRRAGHTELKRQEKYSDTLDWFINHAVVPEERKLYDADSILKYIKEKIKEENIYEFTLHVTDTKLGTRTKKIRYTRNMDDLNTCFFSQIDITDTLAVEEEKQRQLQAALKSAKKANEAKTSFLSRMSHDMRTPMNGVLGLAALMRDETDFEIIAKDIDQLEMSGKYLLQLINDTLDVSKIESGKMELRLKPIDSEMLFSNILTNASIQANEKGVNLVVTKPEIKHGDWISVMADASRLEQVIMNVVSNAVKFTPSGGQVHVIMETASITDNEVVDRYIIRDSGIGMSAEFLEHIYEPFAQEGRTNTSRESGTGLGMSIAKELVELMNGSISIKSEVGKGTEVTLIIHYPICESQPDRKKEIKTDLVLLKNKRILLCEDHPLNAQIAQRLLEKVGVEVIHAENGKIGVSTFSDSKSGYFDIILMDIRMPEMNGLEAAKTIRNLHREDAKTIPIIAMTANAYDDDVKECFAVGMNAHISKPIEPSAMYNTIVNNLQPPHLDTNGGK